MDTRYTDPYIADLWSRPEQYAHWAGIESQVAQAQADLDIIPEQAASGIVAGLGRMADQLLDPRLSPSLLRQLEAAEADTRHDVAAFLVCARQFCPSDAAPWLHYGLTSSDLVDTAQAVRLKKVDTYVVSLACALVELLDTGVKTHRQTPMLGRTHGQPAEPTTLGLRFHQWSGGILRAVGRWSIASPAIGKLSGPVGTYNHNPPDLERLVASRLGIGVLPGDCTQVVPRDLLADWASAAAALVAACGKIALDFRLMAARGEVLEQFTPLQVGSSSMPHKRNPITAEKICGLVRLAQGYAAMLQPVDLWEDRDLSHSCVERVAVPDLLHTVCHALAATTVLVSNGRWATGQMDRALKIADRQPYSAWKVLQMVQDGGSRPEVDRLAAEWAAQYPAPGQIDTPDPVAMLWRNPVVHPDPMTPGMADPCQPIGCDNGYHRPGCVWATSGPSQTLDTEASPGVE
jgi:adenylosuccinate lyase